VGGQGEATTATDIVNSLVEEMATKAVIIDVDVDLDTETRPYNSLPQYNPSQ